MRLGLAFFRQLYATADTAARDADSPELRAELLGAWSAIAEAWRDASRCGYRRASWR